jgi:signal transduction histidine kinase/DNA-binding response OmpR family regulator
MRFANGNKKGRKMEKNKLDPQERGLNGKPSILVVDDDESTQRTLALIFGRQGYEIEAAETGQMAIAKAQARDFNVVFLDIRLPDVAGVELLAPLKALHPDIALIIITAFASLETAVQALNDGASAYINKPLNIDEVLAILREALEKQRLVRENRRLYQEAQRELVERQQAEAALRRRNRELALLNRVVVAATSTLDAQQVLQVACRELAYAFELPQITAALLDAQATEASAVAEYLAPGHSGILGRTIPLVDNPAIEYVVTRKKPLAVSNARIDEQLATMHDLLRGRDDVSLLIVPIIVARDRIAGIFGLIATQQREFNQEELTLAQSVAAAAGQALETARLYQAVRRQAELLEERVARRTVELQIALERAQEADRLKSEFVGNVSHELRTPLTNLKLYLDLLDRGQPEKRQVYLDTLSRETNRLQNLIESLLDISRLDLSESETNFDLTDVNLLVSTLATDRGPLVADRGLRLEADLAEALPPTLADASLLEQMLTNLLTNAVNYTPAGGEVRLCTEVAEAEGEPWVTVSVVDDGPGISPDEQAHIFERFYRGQAGRDSGAPGTGLGLAICHEIIELHGGRITLESAPGQGSAFTVWLRSAVAEL